jgi:hypothetical protein
MFSLYSSVKAGNNNVQHYILAWIVFLCLKLLSDFQTSTNAYIYIYASFPIVHCENVAFTE